MQDGRPSATAQGAALLRAAHQLFDDPRVLDDPLALRIIGAEGVAALRTDPAAFQTSERRHLRAFIAMRSRFAEDVLAQAMRRGVRQYVLLGAGLDTFAYRNSASEALRVFEVDHPATQVWKRQRLREADIVIPDSLTFTPIDFENQTLGRTLRAVGFHASQPAFFSWLGVTVYLTEAAVMQTLRYVASETAPGSEIVFTFVPPQSGRESTTARRTAALGEPWVTFFEPARLERDLRRMGFTAIEQLTPADANRRYFAERRDGLQVGPTGHLMKARV